MPQLTFDANRARAADLIALPASLPGTSCLSCRFYRPEPFVKVRDVGFCSHPRLLMSVYAHWCCAYWANSKAPPAQPSLARRFAKHLVSRYARSRSRDNRPRAGSAEDCGHREVSGWFAPANTCALGGGPPGAPRSASYPPGGAMAPPLGGTTEENLARVRSMRESAEDILAYLKGGGPLPRTEVQAPRPTAFSPAPHAPGKPLRERIASLPGAAETLNHLMRATPYMKMLREQEGNLIKVMAQIQDRMPLLYSGKDVPEMGRLVMERDRIEDQIDETRERISEVVSSTINRTGLRDKAKIKAQDGQGDWDRERPGDRQGRSRSYALAWLRSKLVGRGDVSAMWNVVEGTRAYASWMGPRAEIVVDYQDYPQTHVHEMGHIIESRVAGVSEVAREFLAYRTAKSQDRKLKDVFPEKSYRDEEIGNDDDFGRAFGDSSWYVGKKFKDGTEIVSMGLQKLYEDPVSFAKNDPEYCLLMIGILDGTLRSPDGSMTYG